MKKGSVEFSGTFCMLKTSKWVQCLFLVLFWECLRKKVKPSCPSLLLSWFWHFWQEKHPVTSKWKSVQLLLMGKIYVSSFLLFVMFIWDIYVGCACTVYIYTCVFMHSLCVCIYSLCMHSLCICMHVCLCTVCADVYVSAQFIYMHVCVNAQFVCVWERGSLFK